MNKNVLISGASGGIGRAIALRMAEEGWNVALLAHLHPERAESAALACRAAGVIARVYQVDLQDEAALTELYQTYMRDFGGIDCLVNNAGIAQQKLFTDIQPAEWGRMLDVNLGAVYRLSKLFIPELVRQKSGRIINISSVWGRLGASCEAHYAASKAGMIGLSQSLAKELGPSGITVNSLCPGVIETEMLAGFGDEEKADLAAASALGRLGQPEDVAAAVAFLASEDASFISGQIIGVDGGFGS